MFDSRYAVYLADTAQSRAWHHQVRYRVFCLERGFEPAEAFGDGQERDRWDRHSDHFVVCDRTSGAAVAAMRIVLRNGGRLPVQQLGCITAGEGDDGRQFAEVSRICVARDTAPGAGVPARALARHSEPEILLGLMRAVHRYSIDHDIPQFYMLVTSAFARLLQRLGIECTRVGDYVEHRGLRAPYLVDVDGSWENLARRSGKVSAMFARHYLAYLSHAALQPDLKDAAAGQRVERAAA